MMRRFWDNFEEWVGSVLLVCICLIALVQVIGRYVVSRPLGWTEEAGTILFVHLAFVGASLALKRNEHFALDILVDLLPGPARRWMKMLAGALVVLFAALVAWYGTVAAIGAWNILTPALELRRTVAYAAVPLGGILMVARGIENLVGIWKKPESLSTTHANPAS